MSLRSPQAGYPPGGLHGQLVHAIGRQIASGAVPPGEILPMPVSYTHLTLPTIYSV